MFKIKATEELEVIREKVTRRAIDFNEVELTCLTEVYIQIQAHYGNRVTLNKSCGSCVKEAMNICYNYVTFHEEKIQHKVVKKAKDDMVGDIGITNILFTDKPDHGVMGITFNEPNHEDMTLKQLRKLYPTIKSVSKKGFINQIK